MILKSAVSNALPRLFLFTVCSAAALFLGACAAWKKQPTPKAETSEHVNNTTKFSSKDFGVKGSPRITTAKAVRKGGGRYKVGEPYSIRGKKYYPKDDQNLNQTGMASWYGPNFHGRFDSQWRDI